MEISLFVVLAVSLMFSGVYGQSYSESTSCTMVNGEWKCQKERGPGGSSSSSMSCSTVNGVTTCESQKGSGNVAASSSMASSGPRGSYQNVNAGAGNPGDMRYSSQTYQTGGPFVGGFGVSSSGFAPNVGYFMGSQPPVGGFAGGIAVGGFNSPSPGPAPNSGFVADSVPAVGGFGFATAGSFPLYSSDFSSSSSQSGTGNPPQDSQVSTGNGGGFYPGAYIPYVPGFPGAGAFAGGGYAGAFAGR